MSLPSPMASRNTGRAEANAASAYTAQLKRQRTSGRCSESCETSTLSVAVSTAYSQPNRIWLARMKTKASEAELRCCSSSGTGLRSARIASPRNRRTPLIALVPRVLDRDHRRRPGYDRKREHDRARDQHAQPGRVVPFGHHVRRSQEVGPLPATTSGSRRRRQPPTQRLRRGRARGEASESAT